MQLVCFEWPDYFREAPTGCPRSVSMFRKFPKARTGAKTAEREAPKVSTLPGAGFRTFPKACSSVGSAFRKVPTACFQFHFVFRKVPAAISPLPHDCIVWHYCKLSTKMALYSFLVKTSNHSTTAKLTKYTPSGL